jgi:hypothetical protein
MAHKLRHGLSRPYASGTACWAGTFIGGRGDRQSVAAPPADKSLVVAAVEKVPAPKNRRGKHAVKRQHGFFAGDARIAVLPAATGGLGTSEGQCRRQSHLLTDGFAGYRGDDAGRSI